MLQAYIDESVSPEGGRLFVMAGYAATPEQWMAFSDEWASLLQLREPHWTRIDEFKMSSMRAPSRLKQAELFYRVIERNLDTYVACSIRLGDVVAAFNKVKWPSWVNDAERIQNEYLIGFDTITRVLVSQNSALGINVAIDFIFDEQNTQKAKCLEAWDIAKNIVPADTKKYLGASPVFGDSKQLMPLQAADLLAYWVRESEAKYQNDPGNYQIEFPWEKKKKMTGVVMYQTPELALQTFRNALLSCQLWNAGIRLEQLQSILSPRRRPLN